MTWRIIPGDCIEAMCGMDEASVDAVVCDPPYGLEFMGKEWDALKPGINRGGRAPGRSRREEGKLGTVEYGSAGTRTSYECDGCGKRDKFQNPHSCSTDGEGPLPTEQGWTRVYLPPDTAGHGQAMQEWHYAWATEALRVLKPGGHLLAFGGTRTIHRLVCAIEDAGFEIRDCLAWLYGSGFPKSLDVSKAIDKAAGAEREVVGEQPDRWTQKGSVLNFSTDRPQDAVPITGEPATPEAAQWQGWGTALKPAHEPIVLARKPLTGTVAGNVLEFGTGALNVDGCRVEHDGSGVWGNHGQNPDNHLTEPGSEGTTMGTGWNRPGSSRHDAGRWPANVILDEQSSALLDEQSGERQAGARPKHRGAGTAGYHGWPNGTEAPERVELDLGGASRFFYTAKASRAEAGCRECGATVGLMHVLVCPLRRHIAGAEVPVGVADTEEGVRFFYTAKASRAERSAGLDGSANLTGKIGVCRCHETREGTAPARATDEGAEAGECGSSTPGSGSSTTARSPRASRSTTSTATKRTTGSKTSNSSPRSTTSESTPSITAAPRTGTGSGTAPSAASGSPRPTNTSTRTPEDGFSTGDADPATSSESSKTSSVVSNASNRCPDCGGVIGGALRNSHPT